MSLDDRHDESTEHERHARDDDHTRRRPGKRPLETDASGSWREEYAHASVPQPDTSGGETA